MLPRHGVWVAEASTESILRFYPIHVRVLCVEVPQLRFVMVQSTVDFPIGRPQVGTSESARWRIEISRSFPFQKL